MLSALSKEWHHVVSAWHIMSIEGDFIRSGHRISDVRFRDLQVRRDLVLYCDQRRNRQAGGYGIQGLGGALVEENSRKLFKYCRFAIGRCVANN